MATQKRSPKFATQLPALWFDIVEAAQILRISRAQLYNRIHDGSLKINMLVHQN
jgi:hypothetical protein